MALSAEDKRKIRKEIQRRAQSKMAWKAGGGKTTPKMASMKGWSGFKTAADKKDQTDYIKLINKNKKFKEKVKTGKTGAGGTKAAAAKARKAGSSVKTYISKKATTTAGGAAKVTPSKAMTTKKVDPAKAKHAAGQAWYRKHKAGKSGAALKKVREVYKKRYGTGS